MFVGTGTLGWQFADTWDFPVNKDFTLMQYTGLKDKNGKEIYEGDVIELLNASDNYGTRRNRRVVEWRAGLCTLGFNLGIGRKRNGCVYEIIGNIYENPELLKKS